MNIVTIPRWLRLALWIVGGVNIALVVIAVLTGQWALGVSFGIAGGVCLMLAAMSMRSGAAR